MLSPDLARLVQNDAALVAGRLRLGTPERHREGAGPGSPTAHERTLAAIEQTVAAELGADDFHMRADGPTWLLFFPTLDKASAQACCAKLAEKVRQRLMTDDSPWIDPTVEAIVIEADLKLLTEAADPAALIRTMLDEAAREARANQADALHRTGVEACVEEAPNAAQSARSSASEPCPERAQDRIPDDIEFRFVPVWNASQGVVATQGCEPFRAVAADLVLHGYETLAQGEDSPLVGDLDVATFARAHAAARELLRANDPGIISFPVHWRALELLEPRRRLTLALEQSAPEERKLFAAELAGLPNGAPIHRIQQGVGFLQRYARAVFIHLPASYIRFDDLRGSGAFGVMCRIKSRGSLSAETVKELRRFCFQARRVGLKPVVCGLRDLPSAAALIEAGCVNLQGEAIRPAAAEPHGLRRVTVPELAGAEAARGSA